VTVYLGSTYIGTVNLFAATTAWQVVIPLPLHSGVFTGTLKLTSRSSGNLVQLDGLAVRKS